MILQTNKTGTLLFDLLFKLPEPLKKGNFLHKCSKNIEKNSAQIFIVKFTNGKAAVFLLLC